MLAILLQQNWGSSIGHYCGGVDSMPKGGETSLSTVTSFVTSISYDNEYVDERESGEAYSTEQHMSRHSNHDEEPRSAEERSYDDSNDDD